MTPCVPPAIAEKPPMKTADSVGAQRVAVRRRRCIQCKDPFFYHVGKGSDRWTCSEGCRADRHRIHADARIAVLRQFKCVNAECGKKRSRKGSGLCEACYARKHRNGVLAPPRRYPKRVMTAAGYVKLRRHDHPLADSDHYVFEHRKVLFDVLGSGTQECFWCGLALDWKALVVDHLNENKQDNSPENLVPACNKCNRARGQFKGFLDRLLPGKFSALVGVFGEYVSSKTAREEKFGR